MLKMVIADDEFNIRQGLMTIPWKDFGIEIIGVASNGEEALNLVKEYHPEILLTDIRMPKVDGLKLIESAIDEQPSIKAILLTGYQDFTYAHTAIKLGAFGYVLKPSDPDEIINIVIKAKNQIEHESNQKMEHDNIRKQFDSNKPLMLNSFLQSLIYGRFKNPESIKEKSIMLGLNLENYVVMVIEFGNKDKAGDIDLMSRLKEDVISVSSAYNKCHTLDINQATFCIINDMPISEKETKSKMLLLASEIRSSININFNVYVSIGISKCFNNVADMSAAYNQALNCLKMKFSLGKGAIIHVEDLADSIKRQNVLPLKLEDEILDNIRSGNYRKAEKLSRELLYRLAIEQKASEHLIKSICFNILSSSYRIINSQNAISPKTISEPDFQYIFDRCTDIGELEEYFINTLLNTMDFIYSKASESKNKVIREILEYIEKSYMNEISLFTLSEYIHMNHIYISRMIKKETGETFLDILTRIRMKKACELLKNDDLKTYEISNLIGIKDSGYFSQVFKKMNGATPSEYRDSLFSRVKPKNEANND